MSFTLGFTCPIDATGHAHPQLKPHYFQKAVAVGAQPVLLTPDRGLTAALAACDAVVFTGGPDIPPEYYHATDRGHPCRWLSPHRATWEFSLLQALRTHHPHKKVLGICLGMQWINVACGGTLYQHLPAEFAPTAGQTTPHLGHVTTTAGGHHFTDALHPVHLVPSGVLHQWVGATTLPTPTLEKVASFHHQGIEKLGTDLTAQAHAPDGLIEAIAHQHLPWLGVQWHPERDTTGPTLFRWVVS